MGWAGDGDVELGPASEWVVSGGDVVVSEGVSDVREGVGDFLGVLFGVGCDGDGCCHDVLFRVGVRVFWRVGCGLGVGGGRGFLPRFRR